MRSLLGTMPIRVTSVSTSGQVFIGIAPADLASQYLADVSYDTVHGITHHRPVCTRHTGGAPAARPARGCTAGELPVVRIPGTPRPGSQHAGLVAAGRLDPAVSLTLPWTRLCDALAALAERRISGKAVLTVG